MQEGIWQKVANTWLWRNFSYNLILKDKKYAYYYCYETPTNSELTG